MEPSALVQGFRENGREDTQLALSSGDKKALIHTPHWLSSFVQDWFTRSHWHSSKCLLPV